MVKKKNPSHSEYFTDIESRFWCEILCLPLLFIVIAFNMLQLVLKIFFFLLFGITVSLARALQSMYVWIKSSDYNTMEILHYAYLSDNEKKIWISRVEPYVYKIKYALKSRRFFQFIVETEIPDNKRIEQTLQECPNVSVLHTGSIPEQFGKPLMVFGDLNRLVSNSFPELRSDHDVMFVMEHLQVHEQGRVVNTDLAMVPMMGPFISKKRIFCTKWFYFGSSGKFYEF